ncbi:MAG: NAD(P) transhydrogenase subunit alpha [Candidatus Hydrogenedentota bacterium]
MLVFVPRETHEGEPRVPMNPETVKKLVNKGVELTVETGVGDVLGYADADYEKAGAAVSGDREGMLRTADVVVRLRKPPKEEISLLKKEAIHISYLDPFNETELVDEFVSQGISAIAMEMIPRTTLAQKMDALSSQANLAGYVSVIVGANNLPKLLPMMMTPAGTLAPARVFIIGCGVAGLQAIATAKRLGARVSAFDTRPVVEEQVRSLGAKFVKVELGETGETEGGYAKQLTEEQLAQQKAEMAKVIAQSDLVITTAQVFGRKAPLIVTTEMVESMQPGSVVVDLAVETGGNVECAQLGEIVDQQGVKVIGMENMPGHVAVHATQMYASNIYNLLDHFFDTESKSFKRDFEDEILAGAMIVHDGELRSEMLKNARSQ